MMTKLLSGRWILTVLCGVAFLYSVIYDKLPPEAIVTIISMVFTNYFNRKMVESDRTNISDNDSK